MIFMSFLPSDFLTKFISFYGKKLVVFIKTIGTNTTVETLQQSPGSIVNRNFAGSRKIIGVGCENFAILNIETIQRKIADIFHRK